MPKAASKVIDVKANKPEAKPEPKSPPVFRLYECVIHLEIALAELKRVGIFLGPEEESQVTKELHAAAVTRVEHLYREYLKQWGSLPKP